MGDGWRGEVEGAYRHIPEVKALCHRCLGAWTDSRPMLHVFGEHQGAVDLNGHIAQTRGNDPAVHVEGLIWDQQRVSWRKLRLESAVEDARVVPHRRVIRAVVGHATKLLKVVDLAGLGSNSGRGSAAEQEQHVDSCRA